GDIKEHILQETKEVIAQKEKEYQNLLKDEQEIKEKLQTENQIKKLLSQYKEVVNIYTQNQKKQRKIKDQLSAVQHQIKQLEKFQQKEKEIEQFLEENREIYLQVKNAVDFLKRLKGDTLKQEIQELNSRLKQIQSKTEGVNLQTVESQIKELKKYEEEFIKTKQIVDTEGAVKRNIQKFQEEIEKVEKEVKQNKAILPDISRIQEDIDKLEKERENLQSVIDSLNLKISRLKEEKAKLEKEKELKEGEKIRIQKKLEEIQKLKEKIEKYRKVEQALGSSGIQKIIRETALKYLPNITNAIFSSFGFNFRQVVFSEDFDISLEVATMERKERHISVSSLSGGQKVALGLALRLAIGKLLSNKADFLILDEPTVHLDKQRREELVNNLIQMKNERIVKQLILITHDIEIKDAADTVYAVDRGEVHLLD
ncbi:MAG: hypothetical protein GXO45_01220, partial [Aquificae bacterium]|nr:hypothetical protein [Aquificota bacterium]